MIKFISNMKDLSSDIKVAIYGCGETGVIVYNRILNETKNVRVLYFLDSYKDNITVNNINVQRYNSNNSYNDIDFIILASCYWYEIYKNLNDNCKNKTLIVDNEFLYLNSHLSIYGSYLFNESEINNISSKLQYYKSNDLIDEDTYIRLNTLLNSHHPDRKLRYEAYKQIPALKSNKNQYFEYFTPHEGDIIIEGGVFDGKQSLEIMECLKDNGFLYAFDPCSESYINGPYYKKLNEYKNFNFIPKGLGETNKNLKVKKEKNSSNSICLNDNTCGKEEYDNVEITTIDSFVNENKINKVDFIKLDIEGMEEFALKGANKVIKEYCPNLAVSCYHRKEDIYVLIDTIINCNNNYKFKVANYTDSFIDFVLYAFPNDKL